MKISENTITMRIPDNWHGHFRDDLRLPFMVGHVLRSGWRGRFLAMPNLLPPILTLDDAVKYGFRIHRYVQGQANAEFFLPVLTIQITEETTPEMILEAYKGGVHVAKVYPRDVTTNSKFGVVDYLKIYPALAMAERLGMVICFHGESPDLLVEGKDKEQHFIVTYLNPIRQVFPKLRIVLEHITTQFAVNWILSCKSNTAATIAVHYLSSTQDDVIGYTPESKFNGDPHLLCKPMHKWRQDRDVLRAAAVSGDPRFFYGGDDAPHFRSGKEFTHCACGVFNTTVALPLLVKLFDELGKLDMLEDFISRFGAEFYGFPLIDGTIDLVKRPWKVPSFYPVMAEDGLTKADEIVPMWADRELQWQIAE